MSSINFETVQLVISGIRTANTIADLETGLADATAQLGFELFCLVQVDAVLGLDNHKILTNYPRTWLARTVVGADYRNDPVVQRAASTLEPFDWDELDGLDHQQHDYMIKAQMAGLKNGYSAPLHVPGVVSGLFSFVNRLDRFDQRWSKESASLIAAHGFERLRLLTTADRREQRLTPLQSQCLIFVARGKTTTAVAATLRLSKGEVEAALKNVQQLYRSRGRIETVLRALVARDITIEQIDSEFQYTAPSLAPARLPGPDSAFFRKQRLRRGS